MLEDEITQRNAEVSKLNKDLMDAVNAYDVLKAALEVEKHKNAEYRQVIAECKRAISINESLLKAASEDREFNISLIKTLQSVIESNL